MGPSSRAAWRSASRPGEWMTGSHSQPPSAWLRPFQTGRRPVAEAFGYTAEELTSIPAEANMGLSCGNPTAIASIRPGEVVIDLGSGGGLDVFLASQLVGPQG